MLGERLGTISWMWKTMNKKLSGRYFLDAILSVFAMGVALFWSAGRLNWWPAWAAIAVWLSTFAAMYIVVLRFNPGLLAERLAAPKESKTWDKTIMSMLRLLQLVRYILAGLDQRYGWTGDFPLAAQLTALMVCALSYAVLIWAMANNNFFSQIVRVQADRGHVVVTGGPYRAVRHPAYAGMILFELGISTLLGSWWAILAGALCAILIIIRTALEDRTLQVELSGYADYARQVRFRLIPGIW
jgi:protein-S-isoprenylcysteine O-methyltransferase Ste14